MLATEIHGATRASLCEVRLPGRASRVPCVIAPIEEIWHVTAGRGRVWRCPPGQAAQPVEVTVGDTLVIPTGWDFQFSAALDADLRFLCYASPSWPGAEEAEPAEPRARCGLTPTGAR